ncbi:hypothetical protein MTO96_019806 [Rhipicephalus appendiculatus]
MFNGGESAPVCGMHSGHFGPPSRREQRAGQRAMQQHHGFPAGRPVSDPSPAERAQRGPAPVSIEHVTEGTPCVLSAHQQLLDDVMDGAAGETRARGGNPPCPGRTPPARRPTDPRRAVRVV